MDAVAGFTQNFASLTGAWGVGTYFSTKPQLATQFGHTLQAGDLAFSTHPASVSYRDRHGLKQVLAVDVLTGKSKHMAQNRSLRMPPRLEDASVGQYVLPLHARHVIAHTSYCVLAVVACTN